MHARLPAALQSLDAYSDVLDAAVLAETAPPGFVETHISWVFIVGNDVFKVKKPVRFDFLDFSTLALRRAACDAELVLNRRWATDVYLGVVPVSQTAGRLHLGPGEEVVDWAVHMRRLPHEHRTDVLVGQGTLDADHIDRIATHIVAFHNGEGPLTEPSLVEDLERHVVDNLRDLETMTEDSPQHVFTRDELVELEQGQRGFLSHHADVLENRLAQGRYRDGHGDLRLEHVYLDVDDAAAIHVIDCVEFAREYRAGDVCSDVAFLAMELQEQDRHDLAERLLAVYARDSNDFGIYDVVDFYIGYRACVRAKIAGARARQLGWTSQAGQRAARRARHLALLALSSSRPRTQTPFVIAIGGLIAAGKSSLSNALGLRLCAPIVEADRTRKFMVGARPTQNISTAGTWGGAYDPNFSDTVYAEMRARGARVLDSGRGVILDASFRKPEWRAKASQLAIDRGIPFLFVEATAPVPLLKARLVERARHASVSDGRLEIFDDFMASYQAPGDELEPAHRFTADTTLPIDTNIEAIVEQLSVLNQRLLTVPD